MYESEDFPWKIRCPKCKKILITEDEYNSNIEAKKSFAENIKKGIK